MKSNIGIRTYMTIKYENLLRNGFDEIIEFILSSKCCYQINDQNNSLIISKSILKDSIWIAKGHRFPYFDCRRLSTIKNFGEEND